MKGRSIVALFLVGFVLVAAGVIWRRSYGSILAREQSKLEDQRAALQAERAKLKGDIRDASSRSRLAGVVTQRLDMRDPSDSMVRYVERTPIKKGKDEER
jgi:cell division protein FtsL